MPALQFVRAKKFERAAAEYLSEFAYACTSANMKQLTTLDFLNVSQGMVLPIYKIIFDPDVVAQKLGQHLIRYTETLTNSAQAMATAMMRWDDTRREDITDNFSKAIDALKAGRISSNIPIVALAVGRDDNLYATDQTDETKYQFIHFDLTMPHGWITGCDLYMLAFSNHQHRMQGSGIAKKPSETWHE